MPQPLVSPSDRGPLGQYLWDLRHAAKMSLREVEETAGVSNAYVSQLETGKIREPSPGNLHKLGTLYGLSYAMLLGLAGYPVPGREATPPGSTLAARLGPVTTEEEDELADYLRFLRAKKGRGGR